MALPETSPSCSLEYAELHRRLAALELENQILREKLEDSGFPLEAPCESVDQVLAGVFAASPTGLAVTDEKGLFLAVNAAYARLHGYTPEELVGRLFTVVVPPEKQELALTRHAQFLSGREPAPDQWDIVRKGGDRIKVFAETGRIVLPGLRCLKVLSLTDVTTLMRTDTRRSFLASIVENSPDIIVGFTPEGTIVSWNQGAEKAYGYTAKEAMGQGMDLIVPPELSGEFGQMIERLGRDGTMPPFETVRLRKGGERFPVSLAVSPVRNQAGTLIAAATTARDITRRKSLEENLREREARIRAMSQASLDALVMIDSQAKISFWSPSAERMFGYSQEEALGQDVHGLIAPPDQRAAAARGMARFAASGQGAAVNNIMNFKAMRKDGSLFPVERAVAAFSLEGSWHAVGSIRDVTERQQTEDRLRELATVDELTGLLNRRRFMELATQSFDQARRYNRPLSLIMLDVDRFKLVNDTHGHAVGDLVLKGLARTCRGALRDVDLFGRLGGEEFAVLLPETSGPGAVEAAERLRKAQAEARVPSDRGEIAATISLGVSVLAETTPGLEALLRAADEALYAAKRNGRNRVEVAGAACSP